MKEEKVDKGFELNYYNLSYRRRFIRTLWMILALCLLDWIGVSIYILLSVAVIFVVVGFIQALHNYKKWKDYN